MVHLILDHHSHRAKHNTMLGETVSKGLREATKVAKAAIPSFLSQTSSGLRVVELCSCIHVVRQSKAVSFFLYLGSKAPISNAQLTIPFQFLH